MKTVLAAVFAIAVVIPTVAVPPSAYAGPRDNENAIVDGVTPVKATGSIRDCPKGYHCIWTRTYWEGKVFRLYHCRNYTLHHWNGFGSDFNNQTGGAVTYYFRRDGTKAGLTKPGTGSSIMGFTPVWYIKPC